MATIKYTVTFLGTIPEVDNTDEQHVMNLIADDAFQYGIDITVANDVEYEIEDCDELKAEIAEYEKIATVNPYCI